MATEALKFTVPLVLEGEVAIGEHIKALPFWDALPALDGGKALAIMREAMKLSHVEWEMAEEMEDEADVPTNESDPPKATSSSSSEPTSDLDPSSKKYDGLARDKQRTWTRVPEHAKPFPWDGQEIVPVSELVGRRIRAVGTFVEAASGEPIVGLPKSYSHSVVVGIKSTRIPTIQKALKQNQLGFHATTNTAESQRLAVFIACPPPTSAGEPPQLFAAVKSIPDDDSKPMETVIQGFLPLHVPACKLVASDEVSLSLLFQRVSRGGSNADAPTTSGEGAFHTVEEHTVCLRSRLDRDMVSLMLWALQCQLLVTAGKVESGSVLLRRLNRTLGLGPKSS